MVINNQTELFVLNKTKSFHISFTYSEKNKSANKSNFNLRIEFEDVSIALGNSGHRSGDHYS